ncbi:hypothetical protein FA95DRAFT_1370077 [Auriscalpium vulgare]|uniref:Uncharacterized protein n=1 Tax=Auriscalpium vulgare TaxID=40419 RepID=A0ACB8RQ95_9AGAM|nr:hypothetical protein FA95DRAFT_1370077 [Auriscalpium vulgare]
MRSTQRDRHRGDGVATAVGVGSGVDLLSPSHRLPVQRIRVLSCTNPLVVPSHRLSMRTSVEIQVGALARETVHLTLTRPAADVQATSAALSMAQVAACVHQIRGDVVLARAVIGEFCPAQSMGMVCRRCGRSLHRALHTSDLAPFHSGSSSVASFVVFKRADRPHTFVMTRP